MVEKDYNPEQKMKKINKLQEQATNVKVVETPKTKIPVQKSDSNDKKAEGSSDNKPQIKPSEPASETKDTKKKKQTIPKKAPEKKEVCINARSVPISTKYSIYICRFIKNKSIQKAIADLELVLKEKKAIPMRGEIPHKKSVKELASGSGRYPQRAAKHFIGLLKSLQGNANNHNVENPIIFEAIANKAQKPFGRFGRWQRKRTHVTLKAKSKKELKKKKRKK